MALNHIWVEKSLEMIADCSIFKIIVVKYT